MRKRVDPEGIPESLILLGNVSRLEGDYRSAANLIGSGLRTLEQRNADANRLSSAYNYQSLIDNNAGRYADAEASARKALALAQTAKLGNDVTTRHCVVLANALRQQGRYDEALKILVPAVEALKVSRTNPVLLGTATNNLGALYFWTGDYHNALDKLNEGLSLRIAASGADHPDVANSLLDLGCTEFKLELMEEAQAHLEQSLAIRRTKLGSSHPDSLATTAALAVVYQATGRTAEALALLNQAVLAGEKVLGSKHPDLARYKSDYASCLAAAKQLKKANKYQTDALRIVETVFGSDSREYGNGLRLQAQILQDKNSNAAAAKLLMRSAAIFEKNARNPDPEYAGCLEDLAAISVIDCNFTNASLMLSRAAAFREAAPPSIDYAVTLANLADVLERLNRLPESRQTLRKAKAIVDALPERQQNEPECASILDRYSKL